MFEGLGITQVDHRMPRRAAEKLSVEYVRAMKQGQTLGLLIQREGREQVEKRVIEKAQSDPIFVEFDPAHSRDVGEIPKC